AASVKFEHPYFENDEPLNFRSSSGNAAEIGSFGIREQDDYAFNRLREQIQILYLPRDSFKGERQVAEFIVDPFKTSRPYQIVLARIGRKSTLAATITDVEKKIAAKPPNDFMSRFNPADTLLVPNIAIRIEHHFRELEGEDKQFSNPALRDRY